MMLNELFSYATGNLPALELTEEGTVPLVYGTSRNNGIVKLVKTYEDTKIFQPPLITVSYLGTAFVQVTPFTTSVVDKSNITVLIPKKKMKLEELYFYAYQINAIGKFGFNYGRRMNQKQLNKINLREFNIKVDKLDFTKFIDKKSEESVELLDLSTVKEYRLDEIFDVTKGKGDYKENYDKGSTPLVSATTFNNGILEYVDAEPSFKAGTITVERIKGTAFVQLKDYVTVPDDIHILTPKMELKKEILFYFSFLIRRESWKYSYGRKVTSKRLKEIKFILPTKNNEIDFETISNYMINHYGWDRINKF